jgi:hypothetical protein
MTSVMLAMATCLLAVMGWIVFTRQHEAILAIEDVILNAINSDSFTGKVLALIDLRTLMASLGFASFNAVSVTSPNDVRTVSPLEGYFWLEEWITWSHSATDDWSIADLGIDLGLSSVSLGYVNDAVALNKNLCRTKSMAMKLAQSAYGVDVIPEIYEVSELVWDTENETFYEQLLAQYPGRPMWPGRSQEDLSLEPDDKLALARSLLSDDVFFDVHDEIQALITTYLASIDADTGVAARESADHASFLAMLTGGLAFLVVGASIGLLVCAWRSGRFGKAETQGSSTIVSLLSGCFVLLALSFAAFAFLSEVAVYALYPPVSVQAIPDSRFEVAGMLRDHRLNINRFAIAANRFAATGELSHLHDAHAAYEVMLEFLFAKRAQYFESLTEANYRDFLLANLETILSPLLATVADAPLVIRFVFAALRLAAVNAGIDDATVAAVFPAIMETTLLLTDAEVLAYELEYGAPPFLFDLDAQLGLATGELGHVARMALSSAYMSDLFGAHLADLVALSIDVQAMQAADAQAQNEFLEICERVLICVTAIAACAIMILSVLLINTLLPARCNTTVPIVQKISSAVLARASFDAYAYLVGYFVLVALVGAITLNELLLTLNHRPSVIDYGYKRSEAALTMAFAATRLVTDPTSPTLHKGLLQTGFLTLSDLQRALMYGVDGPTGGTTVNPSNGLLLARSFELETEIDGAFGMPSDDVNSALLVSEGPCCYALDGAPFSSATDACIAAVPETAGMREAASGALWPLILGYGSAAEALAAVPNSDLSMEDDNFRFLLTLLPSLLYSLGESNNAYHDTLVADLELVTLMQKLGWGGAAVALLLIYLCVLERGINSLGAEDEIICSMLARLPPEVISSNQPLKEAVTSVLLTDQL